MTGQPPKLSEKVGIEIEMARLADEGCFEGTDKDEGGDFQEEPIHCHSMNGFGKTEGDLAEDSFNRMPQGLFDIG